MKNLLWYQNLNKPFLTPPSQVFAPVWTILYILMTVSLVIYIKTPTNKSKKAGLVLFFVQLALNILWPFVFFEAEYIELAAVICILLIVIMLMVFRIFYSVSKSAAMLLVPYLIWLCLATYLSIEVVRLNS